MPLYSDSGSYYYSGGSSQLYSPYYSSGLGLSSSSSPSSYTPASSYAPSSSYTSSYNRAYGGSYMLPLSQPRTPSYTSASSVHGLPSRYQPKLTTITETTPLVGRHSGHSSLMPLTRIQSPKYSSSSYTPTSCANSAARYIPARPIAINTADIDVSSARYGKREADSATESKPSAAKQQAVEQPVQQQQQQQQQEEPSEAASTESAQAARARRSTIRRNRPVVRLSTIRKRSKERNKEQPRVVEQPHQFRDLPPATEPSLSWRQKLAEDLAAFPTTSNKKSPGELLRERFYIHDEKEPPKSNHRQLQSQAVPKAPAKKDSESDAEEEEVSELSEQEVKDTIRRLSLVQCPTFHDICKDISSDKIDDDLNAGELRRRASLIQEQEQEILNKLQKSNSGTFQLIHLERRSSHDSTTADEAAAVNTVVRRRSSKKRKSKKLRHKITATVDIENASPDQQHMPCVLELNEEAATPGPMTPKLKSSPKPKFTVNVEAVEEHHEIHKVFKLPKKKSAQPAAVVNRKETELPEGFMKASPKAKTSPLKKPAAKSQAALEEHKATAQQQPQQQLKKSTVAATQQQQQPQLKLAAAETVATAKQPPLSPPPPQQSLQKQATRELKPSVIPPTSTTQQQQQPQQKPADAETVATAKQPPLSPPPPQQPLQKQATWELKPTAIPPTSTTQQQQPLQKQAARELKPTATLTPTSPAQQQPPASYVSVAQIFTFDEETISAQTQPAAPAAKVEGVATPKPIRKAIQKSESGEDFWSQIGSRETLYMTNRKKALDSNKQETISEDLLPSSPTGEIYIDVKPATATTNTVKTTTTAVVTLEQQINTNQKLINTVKPKPTTTTMENTKTNQTNKLLTTKATTVTTTTTTTAELSGNASNVVAMTTSKSKLNETEKVATTAIATTTKTTATNTAAATAATAPKINSGQSAKSPEQQQAATAAAKLNKTTQQIQQQQQPPIQPPAAIELLTETKTKLTETVEHKSKVQSPKKTAAATTTTTNNNNNNATTTTLGGDKTKLKNAGKSAAPTTKKVAAAATTAATTTTTTTTTDSNVTPINADQFITLAPTKTATKESPNKQATNASSAATVATTAVAAAAATTTATTNTLPPPPPPTTTATTKANTTTRKNGNSASDKQETSPTTTKTTTTDTTTTTTNHTQRERSSGDDGAASVATAAANVVVVVDRINDNEANSCGEGVGNNLSKFATVSNLAQCLRDVDAELEDYIPSSAENSDNDDDSSYDYSSADGCANLSASMKKKQRKEKKKQKAKQAPEPARFDPHKKIKIDTATKCYVKEEAPRYPLVATPRPLWKREKIVYSDENTDDSSDEGSEATGSLDDDSDDESEECTSTASEEFEDEAQKTVRRAEQQEHAASAGSSITPNSTDLGTAAASSTASSPSIIRMSTCSNDSGFEGGTAPSSPKKMLETSYTYSQFQKSGRFTAPATVIPRFKNYSVDDFHFLAVLGKGSFGKVLLAELRDTTYYYAVKCLKKDVVLEDDDVDSTLIERKVLALGTKHPYLCHLFCTFQTESHLFFVMEYLNGGDLMFHIQESGRFEEERARFYGAEIISGLKFLHKKGIIYRDLKLDNVLLDYEGHVRIADFGMCKLQIYLDKTADSFCGTPDYMAPEIIKGEKYNQNVDWWSFGVLLYEMLIGQSPFSGCDEDELFWSICNEIPWFPVYISAEATGILKGLLEKDYAKRIGSQYSPAGDIADHIFFRPIDWNMLEKRQIEPPFKPQVKHPLDTQYFDRVFTRERVRLTPIDKEILASMDQKQFHGFTYTNPHITLD